MEDFSKISFLPFGSSHKKNRKMMDFIIDFYRNHYYIISDN